jgi:hypothetical protein
MNQALGAGLVTWKCTFLAFYQGGRPCHWKMYLSYLLPLKHLVG